MLHRLFSTVQRHSSHHNELRKAACITEVIVKEHCKFGPRHRGQRLGSDACSKFPGIFQLLFRQPSVEAQEPGESLERGFLV